MKTSGVLLALALSLLASATWAQERVLTLERAVALATERAPQLQAQAAALDAARARAVAAGRLPDPELALSIDDLPTNGPDAYSFTRDSFTMRRTGIMQAFPNARKRAAERQTAQAEITVVRANTEKTALEISRSTAEAWIDAYAAEQLFLNLNALKPELQLQVQATRAAMGAGRAPSADALAAQAAVFDLDDRLLDAQRDIQMTKAALSRWIGADAAALTLGDAPALESLSSGGNTLLADLQEHARVLTYEARISVAKSEVERATAEKRPDWSAGLSYAFRDGGFSDLVTLEFKVGLPIFTRLRQDPMISAKRAEVAELEADRETELRIHREEVVGALARWQSARDRIELYQRERLPLARERTKAAVASYRAGGMRLADAMASVVAELELQRSYVELTRECGRAWAFLRYLKEDVR